MSSKENKIAQAQTSVS